MSKLFNLKGFLAVSCALVIGMSVSAVWAYELPGIPGSGFPAFGNPVRVDLNAREGSPKRIELRGRDDFLFAGPSGVLLGHEADYKVRVDFDKKTGALSSGTLEIKGKLPDLGINDRQLLVTADVVAINLDGTQSGKPLPGGGSDLWGFKTDNIICSPLLLINCTTTESIYVELDNPYTGSFDAKFRTTGFAITTVPLPAAAWLFGSALGLLGWVARKRAPGLEGLAG